MYFKLIENIFETFKVTKMLIIGYPTKNFGEVNKVFCALI